MFFTSSITRKGHKDRLVHFFVLQLQGPRWTIRNESSLLNAVAILKKLLTFKSETNKNQYNKQRTLGSSKITRGIEHITDKQNPKLLSIVHCWVIGKLYTDCRSHISCFSCRLIVVGVDSIIFNHRPLRKSSWPLLQSDCTDDRVWSSLIRTPNFWQEVHIEVTIAVFLRVYPCVLHNLS